MSPLLQAQDVSKAFAGVQALHAASFELRRGEVHALVGENGAGKSTLVKVLTGALQPDAGRLLWNGEEVVHASPRAAKTRGIAAIYQQPALFRELSVAENIALGSELPGAFRRVDWGARRRAAAELLARVGAEIDPDEEAGALSMAEQQLVEIARALGSHAQALIMDEPTAAFSSREAEHLHGVVRELRAQGVGIVYISHRLEEINRLADRVTVLRDGQHVATRSMVETTRGELVRLMVGREVGVAERRTASAPGNVVLELRGFGSLAAGVHDVNLAVRAGEIVGMAGLVGAGRTELARAIFGLAPADSGELRLKGRTVRVGSPSEAIASGIAYLPEDRRRQGVVPELPIRDNISLAILARLTRRGAIDRQREGELALDYCERLRVKAPSLYAPVGTLSGGNQQKVALSRWLASGPAVLILDEPTQGVDIGAKEAIHTLIAELAAGGMAILLISSDLPEVLGISHRIAVMRRGTIVGVLEHADATQERILDLALGGATSPLPSATSEQQAQA